MKLLNNKWRGELNYKYLPVDLHPLDKHKLDGSNDSTRHFQNALVPPGKSFPHGAVVRLFLASHLHLEFYIIIYIILRLNSQVNYL